MRKGWKIFWITCAVLFTIGVALCITSLCLGVTAEAINERFPYGIASYDSSDTGDTGDMEESFDWIDSIEADVTGVTLKVAESDTDRVKLKTDNVSPRLKFSYSVDGGELFVTTKESFWRRGPGEGGTITIYLPPGYALEEAQFNVGAGKLEADRISADSLDIKVGAGAAEIGEFVADEVDMKCGAGQIVANGSAYSEMNIDCGVGEIDVAAEGRRDDYSYELKCGIGEINLDGENYSGLSRKRQIDNNTGREIYVKCGIGRVGVTFSETI